MKTKRLRIGLATLLLALLGVVVWLVLFPREGEPDPVYQGRPLSAWLDDYMVPGPRMSVKGREAANAAVRHLGTNAFPMLLRRLGTKDAPVMDGFYELLKKQHFIKIHHLIARHRRMEALLAFDALGAEGKGAVPALIELYEQRSSQSRAMVAAVIGSIGPEAKAAVPVLLSDALGGSDVFTRHGDILALGRIHSEPQQVVPALVNCLSSPDAKIRSYAALALVEFGADARSAVPKLIGLLTDGTPEVRNAAGAALRQIDPEAAKSEGRGGAEVP